MAIQSLRIELPDAERGMSPAQLARFDKLQRKLLRPDLRPAQREATRDELDALIAAPRIAQERQWQQSANDETVALAEGRHEAVKVVGPATRILSRTGLVQAYEDGHLGERSEANGRLTAGIAYRAAFELAEGKTTGERGLSGFGPRAPQVKKLEAAEALKAMRAKLTPRQQEVLDLVCGHDMRLRVAATQLRRGFPATKIGLRAGLSALIGLKIERDKTLAERVRVQTDAICRTQNAA